MTNETNKGAGVIASEMTVELWRYVLQLETTDESALSSSQLKHRAFWRSVLWPTDEALA